MGNDHVEDRRWDDNIKIDLKSMCCEDLRWIEMTSREFQMVGFRISGAEFLGSATSELLTVSQRSQC